MTTNAQTLGTATSPPPVVVRAGDVSPVSGWRNVFSDWTVVGGATACCHVLGAATSLLLRLLLDPAQMGIWQALKLLVSYGNYANFGVSKGAAREFTVALGHGDTRHAERGLNLAFALNTITSGIYGAVLVGAGCWIAWCGGGSWSGAWGVGLVVVAVMAVLSRYVTFHVTILRAKQAFWVTSRLSVLEASLTLTLCGLATWRFGLVGLYGGTLAVMAATLVFVIRHRGATLGWAWDAREIRRLVTIGAPILLAGTVSSLFRSLDKLMILGYMTEREFQLGCYSVALLVSGQLYGLGNMLAMVMAPRYGEKFGSSGDRREVAQLAGRATELIAAALALPAGLAIVVAAAVLGRLLPDYAAGLAPVVWLVPGVLALCLALPASQYLIAVDCQRRALAAVVAATALAAIGNHVALKGGHGLSGVALATAAGYGAYFALAVAISIWPQLERRERLRYTVALALFLLPTLAVAVVLERAWPGLSAGWMNTVAKGLAVTIVWGCTIAVGWRYGHWRDAFGRPPSPRHTAVAADDVVHPAPETAR